MGLSLDKTDGAPAAGREAMSLNFEIQPTTHPTS